MSPYTGGIRDWNHVRELDKLAPELEPYVIYAFLLSNNNLVYAYEAENGTIIQQFGLQSIYTLQTFYDAWESHFNMTSLGEFSPYKDVILTRSNPEFKNNLYRPSIKEFSEIDI